MDNLVPGYCSAKLVTQRKTDILKKMEVYIAESRHDINAKLLDDGVMLEVLGKGKALCFDREGDQQYCDHAGFPALYPIRFKRSA